MAKDLGVLTSPGVTDTIAVSHFKQKMFTCDVTGIGTELVLRIEGSYDKVNWENIDRQDLVLTDDDTYNLIINEDRPVDFIRLRFVSSLGGSVSVAVKFRGKT